jgi:multiple sugar transport system substrate-binding protein
MRRLNRTYLTYLATGVMALGLAAGCGGGDDGSGGGSSGGGPTTITFWNGFTDADRPAVEEIVGRFNESHDEVVVDMTIQPWDVINQTLLSAYSAGEGPTIVGIGAEQFAGYVSTGAWAPVDEVYDGGQLDVATLPQASIEATTYEGARYGVPMSAAAGMLYYNQALFDDAGLPGPPESLEQLAEYAVTLTDYDPDDETNSQYGFALPDHGALPHWPVLMWADGGGVVAEDNRRSLLGEPASIETAQFWTDLLVDGHISPVGMSGVEGDNLFAAGRAAMVINGPWSSGAFTDAGIEYGIAPVPPGKATQAAAAVSVNMHLDATASDAERAAANEFFAFWNSAESQTYWAVETGYPPNRTDVPASAVADNPTSASFSEAVGARVYLQGLTTATQINDDVVVPTVQRMTRGEGTPADLLTEAASQVDALLAEQ